MQSIGPDIWIERRAHHQPPFGNIGGCATIVRTDSGLAVISPVKDLRVTEPVAYLISPNPLHHLYLPEAKAKHPDAKVIGPAATAAKHPDLKFDEILTEATHIPGLLIFRVPAKKPILEEFVFFHERSRTLIVCDMFFNVHNPGGWLNHFFMNLNGADRKFTMSRLGKMVFDRDAARAVVEQALKRDVQNVIVAHGEPIIGNAASKLKDPGASF